VNSAQAPPGRERDVWPTLRDDVRAVRTDWQASLRRTLSDLEAFYLDEERRRRLVKMGWVKRWALRSWWLLRALFFKLTPARRVVFVVALLLLIASRQAVAIRTGASNVQVDSSTGLVGGILLVVLLMLELKDKLLARHELEAGRAVQRALMPESAPVVPGWDIWLYTQPANDVGGDLVDALNVDGRVFVALADVAGKALPAALLMAKVQSTLRALVSEVSGLPALAARVNAILCRDGLPNRFATLVYAEIRAGSNRVSLVNAGHLPPLVVSGSRLQELPRGGMALGMIPGAVYEAQTAELAPGDLLVVYSDGVTEATNEAGDFFGDDRLRRLLAGLGGGTAAAAGQAILAAVREFIGDARPYDDLSVVVLRRAA